MTRDVGATTPGYRFVVTVATPVMRWSRLTVRGLEFLPPTGPAIIAGDHDSYWDTMAVAVAAKPVRQIRALAKSSLFDKPVIGALMKEMGQIPIVRGAPNHEAMSQAAEVLAQGACLGIFPEGTRSLGRPLRARSGLGRLAEAVPEAVVVAVRTNGSTDVVRLPKRPRIDVEFYLPAGGPKRLDESAADYSVRITTELRSAAPYEIPGRARTAAKFRARAAE